ncbi:MAG: MCE family protein, partial [Chloroflexi bacterium]
MSVGSDVRIAGRLVGQVTAIEAAGNHANITFHVDDSEWPLPSDTTASVRLATLLGQKYVQLNPGHSTQPLADNALIPLPVTRPVVDFDQILDTFDKPTRDSLTSLIRTAADAVQGEEGTLQQLVPDL